jgi:hypothetical protein
MNRGEICLADFRGDFFRLSWYESDSEVNCIAFRVCLEAGMDGRVSFGDPTEDLISPSFSESRVKMSRTVEDCNVVVKGFDWCQCNRALP